MGFAIDPDETTTVEIDGATFTIGHIPMGVYRRLILEELRNQDDAKRRAIRDLRAAGEEVTEDAVNTRIYTDPEYREQADRLGLEEVRWAVRNHDGLCFTDMTPVPFVAGTDKYMGRPFTVVGADTLRVYEQNFPRIVQPLIQAITAFVSLTEQEKKVSRSPSPSTEASTSAETASAPLT